VPSVRLKLIGCTTPAAPEYFKHRPHTSDSLIENITADTASVENGVILVFGHDSRLPKNALAPKIFGRHDKLHDAIRLPHINETGALTVNHHVSIHEARKRPDLIMFVLYTSKCRSRVARRMLDYSSKGAKVSRHNVVAESVSCRQRRERITHQEI
jgi:hypothetical protein